VAALLLAAAGPAAAVPLPDTGANGQWWFVAWDIPKIWAAGAQGQGIRVAVLDTGVNPAVAGLAGVLGPGTDVSGGTGDGRTDRDPDGTGHGTRMAAFIAGQGGRGGEVGVAPRATLLPVTVSTGAGDPATLFAAGIGWAADHGARVVNLSQAAAGPCPAQVQDAVAYAVQQGAVVVAAAGNQGDAENLAQFPADCKGVLSVGAVDVGRHAWARTQRQQYVDVAAPGVHMRAVDSEGARGYSDGTSDAAALVSGAVALVWSHFPRLTNRQVVARILATLKDDIGRPGRDDATGGGIVRPFSAITQQVPAGAPNPVFDELGRLPRPGSPPATADRSSPAVPGCTAGPGGCTATAGRSGGGGAGGGLRWAGVAVAVVIAVLLITLLASASRRRRQAAQPHPGGARWPAANQGWPPQPGRAAPPGQGWPPGTPAAPGWDLPLQQPGRAAPPGQGWPPPGGHAPERSGWPPPDQRAP
jgi:subtilisin family serine protease